MELNVSTKFKFGDKVWAIREEENEKVIEIECPKCKGKGEIMNSYHKTISDEAHKCRTCKGKGSVSGDDDYGMYATWTCTTCSGHGVMSPCCNVALYRYGAHSQNDVYHSVYFNCLVCTNCKARYNISAQGAIRGESEDEVVSYKRFKELVADGGTAEYSFGCYRQSLDMWKLDPYFLSHLINEQFVFVIENEGTYYHHGKFGPFEKANIYRSQSKALSAAFKLNLEFTQMSIIKIPLKLGDIQQLPVE